jgi:hypothetical protein
MCVTHCRAAVLSIITGGGKWVEITIPMDPLYLSVLVSAEKKFRRCVQSDNPRSRLALGRLHGLAAAVGGHEPTPEAPIAHFIELESAALPRMILRCRGAKRRPDARSSGGVISRMTWAKIAPRCAR